MFFKNNYTLNNRVFIYILIFFINCFWNYCVYVTYFFVCLGNVNGIKRKEWENKSVGIEVERKTQHLSLQVPLRSHSSSSSSEENSSSSAAQPLLAGEKESPSSVADDHLVQKEFLHGTKRDDGQARSVFR